MATLVLDQIQKHYLSPAGPIEVLSGVNLELRSGERVAILGPSGSGKSTLLNIIGGLDRPTAGRVLLDGRDVSQLHERELARYRNQTIGFVFQDHHLLPQCSVLENVLLPSLAAGPPPAQTVESAVALLDRVGLRERTHHLPGQLSGGERQRVALVRALIMRPPVVLADEPTGNLDTATGDQVARLLLDLHQEQQTILIVVTHNQRLADRIGRQLRLTNGKLEPVAVTIGNAI